MSRLRSVLFVLGLLTVIPGLTGCVEYSRRGYGWHYAHGRGHHRW